MLRVSNYHLWYICIACWLRETILIENIAIFLVDAKQIENWRKEEQSVLQAKQKLKQNVQPGNLRSYKALLSYRLYIITLESFLCTLENRTFHDVYADKLRVYHSLRCVYLS